MTPDEYLNKAIDLGFRAGRGESNAFDRAFGLSEKTQTTRRPLADDDDRDTSDSDEAEAEHARAIEPERELVGDDTEELVDVVVPQGDDAA